MSRSRHAVLALIAALTLSGCGTPANSQTARTETTQTEPAPPEPATDSEESPPEPTCAPADTASDTPPEPDSAWDNAAAVGDC